MTIQFGSVQVNTLFTLQSKSDVDKFIQATCPSAIWRNLGDRESPAANVEVSPDPINPLVERLVNGMESLIQLEMELERLTGKGHQGIPSSVFEAAERYFGVPQGRAWNPSITGSKSEDTILATSGGPVLLTKPVLFPEMKMKVEGFNFKRPAILEK